MIFILFGLAEVRGQVWLQSAGSQYSQNSGAQCDTACPLVIRVGMYSNSYPVSPWSVTVSDGNNSVSVNALQLDGGNPLATIVTAGNTTPTINLSTLAAGSGTLTVTDPNNVTTTMPFNIVSCTGGSALLLQFGGHVRVAPNAAGNYLVQVINLGPNRCYVPCPACIGKPGYMTFGELVNESK